MDVRKDELAWDRDVVQQFWNGWSQGICESSFWHDWTCSSSGSHFPEIDMWLLGFGALQQESHGRLLTDAYEAGYHQELHSGNDLDWPSIRHCTWGHHQWWLHVWRNAEPTANVSVEHLGIYFPTFGRKNFEHKFTPVILLLLQCKLREMKVKSR